MPIYVYTCKKCGSEIEKIQRFSDPPIQACPHCQGDLEKILHPPALQFKGSGWYITDYAKKSGGVSSGSSNEEGKSEGSTKKENE